MTTAPPSNWLTALESAKAGCMSMTGLSRLKSLSARWPTCACDELCKALPRDRNGIPTDFVLRAHGCQFEALVKSEMWQPAIDLFHAIEARTAELLAEKGKAP